MMISNIDDPVLIQKAYDMKKNGMFVSDISKKLSDEIGKKVPQTVLWELFINQKDKLKSKEPMELDYPSRKEIEECFSELLQKQENRICIYGGKQLKRNVMIEILNKFYNKEFTQTNVKNALYKTVDGELFYQHWRYLLEGNYIEKVDDMKFKFCDRVKKWKVGFF